MNRHHLSNQASTAACFCFGCRLPHTLLDLSKLRNRRRHYHYSQSKCTRFDGSGRGSWTSSEPGSTRELPIGELVEMHLRFIHDECWRIDWSTLLGLLCHVVMSYGQPDGTINYSEKALDLYDVPASEVEASEKGNGVRLAGSYCSYHETCQYRISAGCYCRWGVAAGGTMFPNLHNRE